MRHESFTLEVPGSAGVGTGKNVDRHVGKIVQFGGSAWNTVTADVEGTVDGTNWKKIGSTVNAVGGVVEVGDTAWLKLRVNLLTYTSGTVTATFAGFDTRST